MMHLAALELATYNFEPDAARAVALDTAMLSALRDSLGTIHDEAEGIAGCRVAEYLARAVAIIRAGYHARPILWALYAELCNAIAAEDIGGANSAAAAFNESLIAAPAPYVSNFDDVDLGAGCAALYGRALDDDSAKPLALVAVDADDVARARTLIGEARDLIGGACPNLLSEMDALVREIVLVKGQSGRNLFSGAATLFLWGAVFINPTAILDRLAMAEALTHEAAHALLTGLTGGLDVTLNDRADRFQSPLREDPRPMEGIAHAAFVLARMTSMLDGLTRLKGLSEPRARDRCLDASVECEPVRRGPGHVESPCALHLSGRGYLWPLRVVHRPWAVARLSRCLRSPKGPLSLHVTSHTNERSLPDSGRSMASQ